MTYRRVQITWRDAESESGWFDASKIHPTLTPVISVGFLIDETRDTYMIAGSVGDDGVMVGDIAKIPKAWADKVEDI